MSSRPPQARDALRESVELVSETWLLALDSVLVIGLRLGQLARLDAAAVAEGERIVAEKTRVALELPLKAATGGFGLTPVAIARASVAYCRTEVSGNRRRLTKRPPRR